MSRGRKPDSRPSPIIWDMGDPEVASSSISLTNPLRKSDPKSMTSQLDGDGPQRQSRLPSSRWEELPSTTKTKSVWAKSWNQDAELAATGKGHSSDWRKDVNPLAFTLPEDDHRLAPFSDSVRGGGSGCCDITSANLPLRKKKENDPWQKLLALMDTSDSESEEGPSGLEMATAAVPALSDKCQADELSGRRSKFPQAVLLPTDRSPQSDSGMECESSSSRDGFGFVSTCTSLESMTTSASLAGSPPNQAKRKRKLALTSSPEVDAKERKRRRLERFGSSVTTTNPASSTNDKNYGSLIELLDKMNPIQDRSQLSAGNGSRKRPQKRRWGQNGKVPSTTFRGPQPRLPPFQNARQGRRPNDQFGQGGRGTTNWTKDFDGCTWQ